jgi:hypothetical protein
MKRLLAWLTLEPGELVVSVTSWWPWWGPYGPEWPVMRVDDRHGGRRSCVPVWDWVRIRGLFKRRPA